MVIFWQYSGHVVDILWTYCGHVVEMLWTPCGSPILSCRRSRVSPGGGLCRGRGEQAGRGAQDGVKQVGADAPWRLGQNRMSHLQVLQRCQNNGVNLSPFFKAPWLKSECFRVDWVHVAEQGITDDCLRNSCY